MAQTTPLTFAVRYDGAEVQGVRDSVGRGAGSFALAAACAALGTVIFALLKLGKARGE